MMKKPLVVHGLLLVYLASGAASLMYEVVWMRVLKLILGNTVYASSIVVSVFMGGLALGALISGRVCDRLRNPLRAYPWIELLITVLAVASPWALRQADGLYVWFCRTYEPGFVWLRLGQILISSMIILIPTLLMGSTLPLLGRFITSVEKQTGPLVGRLYALNTLGAALGCFLAGFFLLRIAGVMGTLFVAALLNLCVAAAGFVLSLVSDRQPAGASVHPTSKPAPGATDAPSRGFFLLVIAFFLSGLVSIAYELLWMRSVVHSMGAFAYVFSAVLTVYLLGNVAGTAIGSRLVRALPNPAAAYAVVVFFLGLCGILYLPWLNVCTFRLLPALLESVSGSSGPGWITWHMMSPLVQSLILFLLPSLIMGIGFPIVLQAWVDRVHRIGWSTGAAYSTNTLGAVTGGLVTGFVLIPRLGLQVTMTILGLVTLWVGGVMWVVFLRPSPRLRLRQGILPVAALAVTLALAAIPGDLFHKIVSVGYAERGYVVMDVKEGINTTVSLHEDPKTKARQLVTSGCRVAGTLREFRGDQKILGHFPVLLNRQAQRVLSVGFGSGESTACQTRHGIEETVCVEIAPEVVDFSLKYFQELNLGEQHPELVEIIYMDAKNYLHLTDRTFDAVVSDCTSIRGVAENASLYTREYFTSARDHLNENGLFMAWIDSYTVECTNVMNSVIGTVMEVFPYVSLWYMMPEPAPFFVIAGSMQPQTYSVAHMDNEFKKPEVAASLAQVNIRDSVDVMSCYVADETDLRRYISSFEVNSDYHPVVELCTENVAAGRQVEREFFETVRGGSVERHIDFDGLSEPEREQWVERFLRAYNAGSHIIMAGTTTILSERLRHCVEGLAVDPGNQVLTQGRKVTEDALLEIALRDLKSGDLSTANAFADGVEALDPQSPLPLIFRSQVSLQQGLSDLALDQARAAFEKNPRDERARNNLWSLLVSMHHEDAALYAPGDALDEGRVPPS